MKTLRAALFFPSLLFSLCAQGDAAPPADSQQARPQQRSAKSTADAERRPLQEQAGKYYALVIGINEYKYLPRLKTAVADAQAIADILKADYGFEAKLLLNVTRAEIIGALSEYRRDLDDNANLLIYYAGHGWHDREADKAYWLPVDAKTGDPTNWISADDITSLARANPARHILIVSDSCYSGGIARDADMSAVPSPQNPDAYQNYLRKMMDGKSRKFMASGGLEPVTDAGGSGHSIFAAALLKGLKSEPQDSFAARNLFEQFVVVPVAGGSDQTPQYEAIRNSGHNFGDFVFMRRGAHTQSAAAAPAAAAAKPTPVREAPRPAPETLRAAPPAAREAANSRTASSAVSVSAREGAEIAGCWQGQGAVLLFMRADGTFVSMDQSGRWELIDAARRSYRMYWPEMEYDAAVSSDGKTLTITGYWGSGFANRDSGDSNVAGSWRLGNLIVTFRPDGSYTNGLVTGSWRLVNAERRLYRIKVPVAPILTVALTPDNQRFSGTDQFGAPVASARTLGCTEN